MTMWVMLGLCTLTTLTFGSARAFDFIDRERHDVEFASLDFAEGDIRRANRQQNAIENRRSAVRLAADQFDVLIHLVL